MNLSDLADKYRKRIEELEKRLPEIAEGATMRAVEKAMELTPPNGALRGANTQTGMLKQHWATDSVTTPKRTAQGYETELNNIMEYASYVNDGHRMDRHFVPGLVINEAGQLEYNPDGKGGIIVGTQTSYVEGLHMVDAAKKVYEDVTETEFKKLVDSWRD